MNTKEKKELTAADLALYIGCDVEWNGVVYRLAGVNIGQYDVVEIGIERNGARIWVECEAVNPILRQLSDMTGEEKESQIWDTIPEYTDFNGLVKHISPVFLWLIRQHFDLFGWIEAGLAIRKTVNTAQ